MALQGTLIWLCSLAALSSCGAQDETLLQNCSSQAQLLEHLSALQVAVECRENQPSLRNTEETATLLLSMRNLTATLKKQQLKDCQSTKPKKCPEAEVPENGGLACITLANNTYCKPMCNHGYDFAFLRISRLYDECSEQTRYKWRTQYVGGNRLAECNKAQIQVSGAKTAYFPKDQDCLTKKSSRDLQSSVLEVFTTELRKQGIEAEPPNACLVCG